MASSLGGKKSNIYFEWEELDSLGQQSAYEKENTEFLTLSMADLFSFIDSKLSKVGSTPNSQKLP